MGRRTRRISIARSVLLPILAFYLLSPPVSVRAQVVSVNKDRATPQLLYNPDFQAPPQLTPEQRAYDYLLANYQVYDLPPHLSNLRLIRVEDSLVGRHFHYQQFINGIPVENAEIIVSVDLKDGKVYMVFNNTYPQKFPVISKRRVSRDEALDIAWNHLRVHGGLISLPAAELFYVPEGSGFRLIYITQVDILAPSGDWEHRIDAITGSIIAVRDTAISSKGGVIDLSFDSYQGPVSPRKETTEHFIEKRARREKKYAVAARKTVNGTARVFDPDPRTTLQNATIQDTDPPATFTNAYLNRTLNDITLQSGSYSLDGPWVRIVDLEPANTAPSTTASGNWTATRGNNAFNDVMTYFHIDQSQRYIQSLGFNNIQHGRIDADSDAEQNCSGGPNNGSSCSADDCPGGSCVAGTCNAGANAGQACTRDDCPGGTCRSGDNSTYHPSSNSLTFGHGCVDDSEDADVILHEYGHAIQHSINSGWSGGDTGAMGEGFGDYWGGSYSYSTPNGPKFHPGWAFSWDAHNNCWPGRVMNQLEFDYDPTQTYPAHTSVGGVDGDELWSTPLFQSFLDLRKLSRPRSEMDKIVLQSHFGLGSGLTMPAMAQSTVTAARTLYPSGPHALVYAKHFGSHNILVTYVDGSWSGTENGTYSEPYNTVSEGINNVTEGARVSLKAGSYTGAGDSPITISKAMSITSNGGTATIGN